jgi:hypothetical protein
MSAVEFHSEGLWNFSVSPQQTWGPVINDASDHEMISPSTTTIPQYAPANGGKKDAAQVVRALESHVAFIEGDPALEEDLELYYYRIVRVIASMLLRCLTTITITILVWFYCNTVRFSVG